MADQQLKIDLTARDKTAAAFRALNNRLATTRKAAMALSGSIRNATLAARALGAGLVVATKKALSFADDIAKTADKVGVSTNALQKYRFAADLAGVKTDELDRALRKLQQSAGEATTKGTGTAFDAFKQLGLIADITSGKLENGEARFRAVVAALEKVESQSNRAGLAAAIFGARLGPQMMNLLNQGIAGLDKTGKRAEALGLIISEQLTRNSEQAIDTITELQTTLKTKLVASLVEAAPLINEFGQELLKNLPNIIARMRELAQLFGLIGSTATDRINALNEEIGQFQKSLDKLYQIQSRRDLTPKELVKQEQILAQIEKRQLAINMLAAQRDKAVSIGRAGDQKEKPETEATGTENGETFQSQQQQKLIEKITKGQMRSRMIAERQVDLMGATTLEREKQLKLEQMLYEIGEAKAQLTANDLKLLKEDLDREYLAKTILEEKLKVDEARNKAAERQKELQQQISDIMQDGIKTANEAISGLISGTMKWKDALGLVLRKVLDIVTSMGKTKGGGFSLGNLLKTGMSLFAASQGVPMTPMGTSTGPMFPGLMDFHTGGIVGKGPKGFRSDERMILARTGERVLNRGQTAMSANGGGVTLNQSINLSTGVQQTVRAEIMSMAPQIAAQAKAAVLDAKRRGGGFGAAFA